MKEEIRLTEFSHGAGCGCKIAPQVLEDILKSESAIPSFSNLLVGNESRDDAAVYDLGNGTAVISTTDFFMPIVDDAFDFGRIASANAISDVYAMGGTPLMAVALLGWPVNDLPPSLAQQVLEGARAICAQAGIPLAGGHSIDTKEPMFGLAVTGTVKLEQLKKNNTAQEGDVLFLTKALGVGVLSTAQKRKVLQPEHQPQMIEQLAALNKIGEALGKIPGVHAMTDVTGFGLAGHLVELAGGSNLSADLYYGKIKQLEGVAGYISHRVVPDSTFRNWNSYSSKIGFGKGVNVMEAFSLLPDPQTNGGLLVAVSPGSAGEVAELLKSSGLEAFAEPIGVLTAAGEKVITVKA
ncbi:selenide, water dikinase SelD [Aridibaculum aurantiacum]|uniref:selenide, water dikinase SelD n=1 Tax=Aridibaculum aurantiacum TaxID=2810307 RepID=UPI001A974A41|nr:selenide, water dikinase SelD [Aridibaculum aurantiacum]